MNALVALRKESVDRNIWVLQSWAYSTVALRKESVDRNLFPDVDIIKQEKSLSARRAWIEIETPIEQANKRTVALRKESVDRNFHHSLNLPSKPVALRKESVDRNSIQRGQWENQKGRSPQGERG